MKIIQRLLLAALIGMAALHAQAAPYFASKDGSMIWDKETGLVWMRCSLGQKWDGKTCMGEGSRYKFAEAPDAALQLNAAGGLGGFTDWEVPTIRQLSTLLACSTGFKQTEDLGDGKGVVPNYCAEGGVQPTIDAKTFPNTPVELFWSSSHCGEYAWYARFDLGGMNCWSGRDRELPVRLVRASQLLGSEATLGFSSVPLPPIKNTWAEAAQAKKVREAAQQAEAKARLQKTLSVGARGLYLQAGQKQRNGDTSEAARLYELIIEHFPKDALAVRAVDQLTAMGRSESQGRAVREADRNASNRAACVSEVRQCEAGCSGSIAYGYCVGNCQRRCN